MRTRILKITTLINEIQATLPAYVHTGSLDGLAQLDRTLAAFLAPPIARIDELDRIMSSIHLALEFAPAENSFFIRHALKAKRLKKGLIDH